MYDVIIIGTGPAGLMAANVIDKNTKLLILEKNDKPGKKLLITGGGRCNVTNLKSNNDFLNEIHHNRKHLYSTINNFGPWDIYNFFIDNNVPLKEEDENKIFPVSDKAVDILNALLKNINTKINYNECVEEIIYKENNIKIITNKDIYTTKNLIVATGGTSFKNTGSSGDHIMFAKMLNQPIIDLYPAETGIILKDKLDLAGISLEDVRVSFNKNEFYGNLMFTHKGLSGSSIMKSSEYIYLDKINIINIDLLPNITDDELYNLIINYNREKEINTFLNNYFPKRLSSYILNVNNLQDNFKIKNLTKTQTLKLVETIKKCTFEILKTYDINEAYVTGGGIDMKFINSKTMESTINKGVYFVGECLDIHGPIGGYNITLALSTGYTAGINVGDNYEKK
ncbi:MAG: aminoacetone oxidase family FAD-binding enzyme [Firmicutes bacterium]|nr:aminoacetone oxidase family FAD-binding enzyme [Bacillota bacterium]